MNTEQFSLMTFSMARDLSRKTMTVEDTLRMAVDSGVPCIDVMRVKEKEITLYQEAMKRTGASVYCYIAVISFFEKEGKILANLEKELRVAAALGAKLFMIVPFYSVVDESKAKKLSKEQVRQYMVQGFRIAVEKGSALGLQVCFETTPQDVLCLSGTEDCRWILGQVSGLGLVFDTANMLPHGDKPLKAYEGLKDHIIHVHLKDVMLLEKPRFSLFPQEYTPDGKIMQATVFGNGVIPVREIFDRMQKDGYKGRFAIEYIHPKGGPMTLAQNMANLSKYLRVLSN